MYVSSIRRAVRARRAIDAPSVQHVTVPVAVTLVIVIGFCIAIAPADDVDFHFNEEDGLVTVLSAIALAMASGFAAACFLIEGRPGHGLRAWWAMTSAGFFFFACDELLRFHERFGTWVRHVWVRSPFFRNWNDIIVAGYGVVAIGVGAFFLPRILRIPLHAELLVIGFGAYVLHTTVDVLPHTVGIVGRIGAAMPTGIVEEGAKLCASVFFAVAMREALRILMRVPDAR